MTRFPYLKLIRVSVYVLTPWAVVGAYLVDGATAAMLTLAVCVMAMIAAGSTES